MILASQRPVAQLLIPKRSGQSQEQQSQKIPECQQGESGSCLHPDACWPDPLDQGPLPHLRKLTEKCWQFTAMFSLAPSYALNI
jgi:hypothetical protein